MQCGVSRITWTWQNTWKSLQLKARLRPFSEADSALPQWSVHQVSHWPIPFFGTRHSSPWAVTVKPSVESCGLIGRRNMERPYKQSGMGAELTKKNQTCTFEQQKTAKNITSFSYSVLTRIGDIDTINFMTACHKLWCWRREAHVPLSSGFTHHDERSSPKVHSLFPLWLVRDWKSCSDEQKTILAVSLSPEPAYIFSTETLLQYRLLADLQ